MQEDVIEEGESQRRVNAGEAVKANSPDTHVAVSLSDENRTFEPWVIEARASEVTAPFKQIAFAQLHQRPTAPLGATGVGVGFLVVGSMCPGMLMGIYHPEGESAVEEWAAARQPLLLRTFLDEIEKVDREIQQEDVVAGYKIPTPPPEVVEEVIDHLRFYKRGLQHWHKKIRTGDLSSVPRTEG